MAHAPFTSHYSHTHTRACILIGAAFSLCYSHSFACFFFLADESFIDERQYIIHIIRYVHYA